MNLEKVLFGFFVLLAATLNFGFFIAAVVGWAGVVWALLVLCPAT